MNGWTEERVEQLKTLWPEGLSCSQIARALGGGLSRNAVIGKAHRLGLAGRAVPNDRIKHATTPRPPRVVKAVPVPPPIPEPLPSERVQLVDLAHHHCRWPIGDVGDPDFGFCGAQKRSDSPYCETHTRRAWNAFSPQLRGPKPRTTTFDKVFG